MPLCGDMYQLGNDQQQRRSFHLRKEVIEDDKAYSRMPYSYLNFFFVEEHAVNI